VKLVAPRKRLAKREGMKEWPAPSSVALLTEKKRNPKGLET